MAWQAMGCQRVIRSFLKGFCHRVAAAEVQRAPGAQAHRAGEKELARELPFLKKQSSYHILFRWLFPRFPAARESLALPKKKLPGRERETPSLPAQNRPFRKPGAEGPAGDDFRGLPALRQRAEICGERGNSFMLDREGSVIYSETRLVRRPCRKHPFDGRRGKRACTGRIRKFPHPHPDTEKENPSCFSNWASYL